MTRAGRLPVEEMRCLVLLLVAIAGAVAPPAAAKRPNVVVIQTDDQTAAEMAALPSTRALIGARGLTFTQSIVSLSQCCPSRATLLTGQYAHNHGVLTTQPPFGGYPAFDARESLAVWLRRAGYETALVGKYLNGYGRDDPTAVPPGWSEWRALGGPSVYEYADFSINDNGQVRRVRGAYKTDFLTASAVDVIERHAGPGPPLFLWLTYTAPHIGDPVNPFSGDAWRAAVPSGLHLFRYGGVPMPMSPGFDEADVTDKPRTIRGLRRLGRTARAALAAEWQRRQESLLSVDRGVERVVEALRESGEVEETLVIFTSDNGYLMGEHRVRQGKALPYEPSIRVPLLMRGPGVPAGAVRSQLVWNGDLAPTIAEVAGAEPPPWWRLDGESLWPLVTDPDAGRDRVVLLEGPPADRRSAAPAFAGVRSMRHSYVEHPSGERELYDLVKDPHQLENLAGAGRAVEQRLARTLRRLRHCRGESCRRR